MRVLIRCHHLGMLDGCLWGRPTLKASCSWIVRQAFWSTLLLLKMLLCRWVVHEHLLHPVLSPSSKPGFCQGTVNDSFVFLQHSRGRRWHACKVRSRDSFRRRRKYCWLILLLLLLLRPAPCAIGSFGSGGSWNLTRACAERLRIVGSIGCIISITVISNQRSRRFIMQHIWTAVRASRGKLAVVEHLFVSIFVQRWGRRLASTV
mmetsp:Transcript_8211/g.17459  ORF Transcript_8211/g.17459 Transcript_8211/m.17459 type:complete len:205 (-) Transcript_8211:540-1154(-)